ncbi:MAG: hypothetical protein CMO81_07825 [Waddliaceae bacterium]|nr:hypothetical protein [Waddliaceae bacterium]
MLDSYFRSSYQKYCIQPLIPKLKERNCSPATITFFALCTGMIAIPFITLNFPLTALFFLLFSGYLDTLDGSLARALNASSPKGALFDIISDRIVECGVVLALFFQDPSLRAIPCLFLLSSFLLCISSFLGVGILSKNTSEKSFHYSPGIIERSESFIAFAALILFPQYFSILAFFFAALVIFTASFRLWQFFRYT